MCGPKRIRFSKQDLRDRLADSTIDVGKKYKLFKYYNYGYQTCWMN